MIKSKDLLLKFEGYVDKGDTQKKIYRDVFSRGDQVTCGWLPKYVLTWR